MTPEKGGGERTLGGKRSSSESRGGLEAKAEGKKGLCSIGKGRVTRLLKGNLARGKTIRLEEGKSGGVVAFSGFL